MVGGGRAALRLELCCFAFSFLDNVLTSCCYALCGDESISAERVESHISLIVTASALNPARRNAAATTPSKFFS